MAYTQFGPFANGSAPGISAAFLNPLESFLVTVNSAATDASLSSAAGIMTSLGQNINPTVVTTNGSTAGVMKLWQPWRGTVKLAIIQFIGFRNNGGSTQGLVPPVPFSATGRSKIWTGDVPSTGVSFQLSGVSQSVAVVTSLSASGGASSNVTLVMDKAHGEILAGWDVMIVPTGGAGTTDGIIVVLGV